MRPLRKTRWLPGLLAAAGVAAVTALTVSASAPAATLGLAAQQAAHQCLVMTGSGDPAFV